MECNELELTRGRESSIVREDRHSACQAKIESFLAHSVSPGWRPFLGCSGECTQIVAQPVGLATAQKRLDFGVSIAPDGNRADQQRSSFRRQRHQTAATVGWIRRDLDQTASPQKLER